MKKILIVDDDRLISSTVPFPPSLPFSYSNWSIHRTADLRAERAERTGTTPYFVRDVEGTIDGCSKVFIFR